MNDQNESKRHRIPRALLAILCVGIVCAVLAVDSIAISWAIVALFLVYTAGMVCKSGKRYLRKYRSKVARHERFLLLLVSVMLFFLVTGTALHLWAFTCEHEDSIGEKEVFLFVNAEYLLRSLACSFMLFTGNIDSNVLDGIHGHQYIKGLISVQAILSFVCTVAVLLTLAYARLRAYFMLHRKTKIDQQHNHLYVFFGMNEPSRLLAESIKKHEGERAIVVFVENSQMDDDDQSGWNSIIGMFTHRRQTFTEADELDARITFTETSLSAIDHDIVESNAEYDIFEELNLLKLKELIGQLVESIDGRELHIFFLSESGDENIRALATLALDKTISHSKEYTHFYCHARRNGLNRIVEDMAFKRGLNVKTIDSSYLAVELLKADEENHPVRFVDLDEQNPTTVKSEFNSLIIGFDEVGRDALKFLYEFGAFVDSKATVTNEQRSIFHCVAIDKRMAELEGQFVNFTPAVMTQKNNDKEQSPLVELKTCDCLARDFFETILNKEFCEHLNYIVVAIGDDDLGMTIAIRILNHIRRVRPDLHLMRIFVRSYHSDKERMMQQIATYYNDGYNKGIKNPLYKNDAVIKLFGQSKEIYSYDMVVNEMLTKKGRKYQESYAHLRGESTLWDARRKKEQEKGTLDSMRSLRRKELQDLGNALHADTKVYLLKKAIGDDFDWEDFYNRYFDANGKPQYKGSLDKIKYTELTAKENAAILNLARLEHLRWNASHEMLGYTKAHAGLHSCDERTREHNCLRPWQELDDESRATQNSEYPCDYKLFDFSVVDNSILLNKEKLLAK